MTNAGWHATTVASEVITAHPVQSTYTVVDTADLAIVVERRDGIDVDALRTMCV